MCLVLLSACSASFSDALIIAHVPNLMRKTKNRKKKKSAKTKRDKINTSVMFVFPEQHVLKGFL